MLKTMGYEVKLSYRIFGCPKLQVITTTYGLDSLDFANRFSLRAQIVSNKRKKTTVNDARL